MKNVCYINVKIQSQIRFDCLALFPCQAHDQVNVLVTQKLFHILKTITVLEDQNLTSMEELLYNIMRKTNVRKLTLNVFVFYH